MRKQELNSGKRMKIERSGRTRYERETGPDCGCNRLECFSKIDRETRGNNTTYIRAVNNEALNHQLGFNDLQSVLRSLRTPMFINIINRSLNGMRIDVIR